MSIHGSSLAVTLDIIQFIRKGRQLGTVQRTQSMSIAFTCSLLVHLTGEDHLSKSESTKAMVEFYKSRVKICFANW